MPDELAIKPLRMFHPKVEIAPETEKLDAKRAELLWGM
jgi:hypothetical protein